MEIDLPSGCNIYYGTYIDNYTNNGRTRTRYYLDEGKLVQSTGSSSQYDQRPTNDYHCLTDGELVYKPEVQVYFPFLASLVFIFGAYLVYKIIIKRLLP